MTAATTLTAAAMAAVATTGALAARPAAPGSVNPTAVRAATTGAELEKTIPITRRRGAKPRVAMSLTPSRLGSLGPGDGLRLSAEAQVTLTCFEPGLARCIGRSYDFSPKVGARLVIATGARVARGRLAVPISRRRSLRCSAHRPFRNHHCVLVFGDVATRIPDPASLPCAPGACFVNLVLDAHGRAARHGNRLIIGADRPDGSIAQDKGRLGSVVIRSGSPPSVTKRRSRRLRHRRLPVHEDGGLRVVYSVRLPALRRGDVVAATARQVTDIGRLPYDAYISDHIVLAGDPDSVRPGRALPASGGGRLTASNGFNCTQGPSHYRTPCRSVKAGVIEIRRRPVDRRGRPRPLYVNLVSRAKPKHTGSRAGDSARLERRGFLDVVRYRSSSSRSKISGRAPR